MKLNQMPNLRTEDFPGEQSWTGRLFTQLNPFIAAVNQTFDNIDFSTNIHSITRDYSITTFQPFKLAWTYKDTPPMDVRIIKSTKGTDLSACLLFCTWKYDATTLVIDISKLYEATDSGLIPVSGTYSFTLRATV